MRHNSFIFNIFQWFHRHLLQSYKILVQNKDREGKGKRRHPCVANKVAARNIVTIYSERGCRRRFLSLCSLSIFARHCNFKRNSEQCSILPFLILHILLGTFVFLLHIYHLNRTASCNSPFLTSDNTSA